MSMRGTPVITGIVLFVAVAVVATYLSQNGQEGSRVQTTDIFTAATTTTRVAQARFVPYGLREYRNTAYRFSFLYPQGLEVKEYPEKGNAITITFQNVKKQEGFQIFIVPYTEPQVSEERFKMDLSSGVRVGVTDMTIDGATAAAFYSENATLGETREVWFIHGGFLFEVTTLKSSDMWLSTILQTWEFL